MDPVAEAAAINKAITLIANGMEAWVAIKVKCQLPFKSRDSKYRHITTEAAKIIKGRFARKCRKQLTIFVNIFIHFIILHNYFTDELSVNIFRREIKKIKKIVSKNAAYSQRNESLCELRRLLNEALSRADKLGKEVSVLKNARDREKNRFDVEGV